eukprot:3086052-Amphidinium_carterae.1
MKRAGEALEFEFLESSFRSVCPKYFWEEDPFLREVFCPHPEVGPGVGTSTLGEEAPVDIPLSRSKA